MRLSHLSRKWATINVKDTFMSDKGRILSCSIREEYFLSRQAKDERFLVLYEENTFFPDMGRETDGTNG